MCVCLLTKFQVSSIILTSFRQWVILAPFPPPPPTLYFQRDIQKKNGGKKSLMDIVEYVLSKSQRDKVGLSVTTKTILPLPACYTLA